MELEITGIIHTMRYRVWHLAFPLFLVIVSAFLQTVSWAETLLLQESFDNSNFASRGWYDSTGGAISTSEHIPGSTASYGHLY